MGGIRGGGIGGDTFLKDATLIIRSAENEKERYPVGPYIMCVTFPEGSLEMGTNKSLTSGNTHRGNSNKRER